MKQPIVDFILLYYQQDYVTTPGVTTRDLIALAALIISIASLIISLLQKRRETRRTIRMNLGNILDSIAKISIETEKLKLTNGNPEEVVELTNVYNTHSRILIAQAELLINEDAKLATEIDFKVLASALTSIGILEKAEMYWKKTIEGSKINSIRRINLRGYADFLFIKGQFELARSKYEEALKLELSDDDSNRRLVTETYIMWAKSEAKHGSLRQFNRLISVAEESCSRIGNTEMKKIMVEQISKLKKEL